MSYELTTEQDNAIAYVKALYPMSWRATIRRAWEDGNYERISSSSRTVAALQSLRNTHGPTWLNNYKQG